MRQGSDRAETFFARFEMAQMEAGYNNIFHKDYIVNLLYKALNYKIVERIFSIHPLLTSFDDWKHHTIQIDQNMHMFRDITSHNYRSGSTIQNRNPQPQYNNIQIKEGDEWKAAFKTNCCTDFTQVEHGICDLL
jgi:hypothetical protein